MICCPKFRADSEFVVNNDLARAHSPSTINMWGRAGTRITVIGVHINVWLHIYIIFIYTTLEVGRKACGAEKNLADRLPARNSATPPPLHGPGQSKPATARHAVPTRPCGGAEGCTAGMRLACPLKPTVLSLAPIPAAGLRLWRRAACWLGGRWAAMLALASEHGYCESDTRYDRDGLRLRGSDGECALNFRWGGSALDERAQIGQRQQKPPSGPRPCASLPRPMPEKKRRPCSPCVERTIPRLPACPCALVSRAWPRSSLLALTICTLESHPQAQRYEIIEQGCPSSSPACFKQASIPPPPENHSIHNPLLP